MEIDCLSYGCSACCEKYWINFTLEEGKKIAKFLNLSFVEFIKKHTSIVFQAFSFSSSKAVFLPEKNNFFSIIPVRAFARPNGKCIFLKNKKCSIYEVRPIPCVLFPDIGKGNLYRNYPFCPFLKENPDKEASNLWQKHYSALRKSFDIALDFSKWVLPDTNYIYFPEIEDFFEIDKKRAKKIIEKINNK